METDHFNLVAKDGLELYGRYWQCAQPKGVLCIVHGLGEHIGRYEHVADYLTENGLSVYAYDQRGHGQSEGKRGHAASYEAVLDDVEEILKTARAEYNDLPLFLYGHSFGANVVANYILKRNTNELAGAILSSAWFKAKLEPTSIEFSLARLMNKIYPSFTQSSRLSTDMLTKDDACNKAYENDPLVHRKLSVRLGLEAYEAGLRAINEADRLKIPTLVWHGLQDEITDPEASKAFVGNAGNKAQIKIWESAKHEPHNDLEKAEVLAYLHKWICDQL